MSGPPTSGNQVRKEGRNDVGDRFVEDLEAA